MKEHATAGSPVHEELLRTHSCTIYGAGAGIDEPSESPLGGRSLVIRVPGSLPKDHLRRRTRHHPGRPAIAFHGSWLTGLGRPIDMAIVEAVRSMTGGEAVDPGASCSGEPGCHRGGTIRDHDAVCMAVMGFDPMADRGVPPFETCDSTLRLAEDVGIGTRDLKRIEVLGTAHPGGRV